jgi:hypothetical protein
MIHQFDHRFATYADDSDEGSRDVTPEEKADPNFRVTPRYWVERSAVEEKLARKNWPHSWLMGWRKITNSTNERTLIASLIPRVGAGDSFYLIFPDAVDEDRRLFLLALLNSLVVDYCSRQKLGGTNFTYGYFKQIAIPWPSTVSSSVISRTRQLMDQFYLGLLATKCIDLGKSFESDLARAELDAIFAALYGLTREELLFILDPSEVLGADYPTETFRGLKENEVRAHGEYLTKRLVLDAWDRMKKEGILPEPVTPWTELSK